MNDEMKRALEELEKDLLEDDMLEDMPQTLIEESTEEDIDAILAKILAEDDGEQEPVEDMFRVADDPIPAFEDPDQPHISDDPLVYCNFSNDYGNDYADTEDTQQDGADVATEDKWLITLMGVASALCVGIIGVLIYWMVAFLN